MNSGQPNKKTYDLLERTSKFGKTTIVLLKKILITPITSPLINQVTRSATSVCANYCEADNAYSTKDFLHKISICRKEARESKHWFEMLAVTEPGKERDFLDLAQEAQELNLIFSAIINNKLKKTK